MLTLDNNRLLKDRVMNGGKQSLIAGLDIGTTKVSCFIAKIDQAETPRRVPLRVIGVGHQVSRGMRKSAVVDLDHVEVAIRAAVEAAENMANTTIREVTVNLSAGHIASQSFQVPTQISGQPISEEDLRYLLSTLRSQYQPEGRIVVHAIPTTYAVDGNWGIKDPRGMFGDELSVRMHMITAARATVRNLALCIERCHLEIVDMVASPYASGLACLVDDEMELGSVCIDMGGGTTTLAVFSDGMCVHLDVIPVGGIQVTNDIARGLSTTLASAERLKTLYGSALASPTDDREMIDVPQIGEQDRHSPNHIPRSLLTGIIQPRMEEIFELVRDRLQESGFERLASKQVVLTGGASQLTGARELAARILEKNVRLARPLGLVGVADAAGGPAFSTCAGLLSYMVFAPAEAIFVEQQAKMSKKDKRSQVARIGRWLKMNF